jgi:hypothetical protein
MRILRLVSALLLALPLLLFGSNHFLHLFTVPPGDGGPGDRLLQSMREGGLVTPIGLAHVGVGAMLLLPRTRFLAALLQLPLTLGILSFHATMLPAGVPFAVLMLLLNLGALADGPRLRSLLAGPPA